MTGAQIHLFIKDDKEEEEEKENKERKEKRKEKKRNKEKKRKEKMVKNWLDNQTHTIKLEIEWKIKILN